jgi:uncharacterized glyoxalase superfamily protein PhnB
MDAAAFRVIRHTRNFDEMLRFYQDSLGMTCIHGWDRPDNRGALLSPGEEMGNSAIEVLDLEDLAVPDTPPINLEFSIEVQDVAEWYDRLVAAGVPIGRGLEDTPWGHRSFGIDDPDGLRIWIYQEIETG